MTTEKILAEIENTQKAIEELNQLKQNLNEQLIIQQAAKTLLVSEISTNVFNDVKMIKCAVTGPFETYVLVFSINGNKYEIVLKRDIPSLQDVNKVLSDAIYNEISKLQFDVTFGKTYTQKQ